MLFYQAAVLLLILVIAGLARRNHDDYLPARPAPDPFGSSPIGELYGQPPMVSILVPARNEAANIEPCLTGLLQQEYLRWELLVLDDNSTDDTAARVERLGAAASRLRLIRGDDLPAGWAGKAHACYQLALQARGEWLLFLDADTRSAPDLLLAAMREAAAAPTDLLSTFPRQEIGSTGEAVMVPYIFWVLFTLLPIRNVWTNPNPAFAAACGQFLLARREAYFETGGHRALRASLHDGLHLARRFKQCRRRVRLVDLSAQISCRMYHSGRDCFQGFSRNAYQAVGSLPALLVLTLVQSVLFLGPFVCLIWGAMGGHTVESLLALLQVTVLMGIQISLQRRFRFPWAVVPLLPAGIVAWIAIQWRGWWTSIRQTRVVWRGRVVAAERVKD